MILIDFSGIAISSIMANYFELKEEMNPGFIRHVILNSIRDKNVRFKRDYGEMVIAIDGISYWRKHEFPHYKHKRKKGKDDSEFDWDMIYKALNDVENDLKTIFPYRVVRVERAEADDVIAVLVRSFPGPHVVVSKDEDFLQLQKYEGVHQWSTSKQDYIAVDDPIAFLKEKIIRGDSGDGIPNILSPIDTFVTGIRQKPMTKKRLNEFMSGRPEDYSDSIAERYRQNERLISFDLIPSDVADAILMAYNDGKKKVDWNKMVKYFGEHGMKMLTRCVDDFIPAKPKEGVLLG